MEIRDINYQRLKLGEFIAFIKAVLTLFTKYGAETLGMETKINDLQGSLGPLDKAFAIEQVSALSKEIEKLDLRRDKAVNGIRNVIKAYIDYHEEAVQKQADSLLRCINKYGDIANLNYQLESESINQLTDEFNKDAKLKAALDALHLTEWVAELKAANDAFTKLYADRNEELAAKKPDGKTLDFRIAAVDKYKILVKHLDAKNTLEPQETLGKLSSELNVLLDKYDRLVKSPAVKDNGGETATTEKQA